MVDVIVYRTMSVGTGNGEQSQGVDPGSLSDGERVTLLEIEVGRLQRLVMEMGAAAAETSVTVVRLQERVEEERAGRLNAEAERNRLAAAAEIDYKTGLFSEDALRKRLTGLNEAIVHSREDERRGKPLRFTLLFLDYDGFGTVNGIVDEVVADRLLGRIGTKLLGAVRPVDAAFRWGGDEGVVIMPDLSVIKNADKEELRARIDAAGKEAFVEFIEELEREGETTKAARLRLMLLYGYSVGIAAYNSNRHGSVEEVLAQANSDMRQQKKTRRVAVGLDPADKNTLPREHR